MERTCLVTGAASGIGRAIAARLERDGARVLAVDLTPVPDGPGEPFAGGDRAFTGAPVVMDFGWTAR